MNFEAASRLADRIVAYWAERGEVVQTYIEAVKKPKGGSNHDIIHCVRSDMLGGFPRAIPAELEYLAQQQRKQEKYNEGLD